MSATDNRDEQKTTYAQAFLQEFYGQGILDRFSEACSAYDCNVADAMVTLKYIVMQNLALEQSYPDFPDLAEMYASKMQLDIESFSQHFYIPRRDQKE